MAGNVTNTLTAQITTTEDSTLNVPINRGTGNPAFDSTLGQLSEYLSLANGANVITLPKSVVYQVYIRNIDAAKSINITWTPHGGISNMFIVLNPGDQLILWCDPSKDGAPGSSGVT